MTDRGLQVGTQAHQSMLTSKPSKHGAAQPNVGSRGPGFKSRQPDYQAYSG